VTLIDHVYENASAEGGDGTPSVRNRLRTLVLDFALCRSEELVEMVEFREGLLIKGGYFSNDFVYKSISRARK
jgi:hypothetical protein